MAKKPAAKKVEKKPKAKPVTGFSPLKFQDHTITQKRSGRFMVVTAKGTPVNGAEKEKLLLAAKVLKGSFKKAGAEAPAAAE
jgi:hypothetical protein